MFFVYCIIVLGNICLENLTKKNHIMLKYIYLILFEYNLIWVLFARSTQWLLTGLQNPAKLSQVNFRSHFDRAVYFSILSRPNLKSPYLFFCPFCLCLFYSSLFPFSLLFFPSPFVYLLTSPLEKLHKKISLNIKTRWRLLLAQKAKNSHSLCILFGKKCIIVCLIYF